MDELVSIVLPIFNAQRYLDQTFSSIRDQTYGNWELLAVLDPLTQDRSAEVVDKWDDARVRKLHAQSGGAAAARNCAIANAKGRWLAFLDADDIWLADKLNKQIKFMIKTKASFSATNFRRISSGGERIGRLIEIPRHLTFNRLLRQNCLCCSSVILDRSQIAQVAFEDVGCEDFMLWLKLARAGHSCLGLSEDLVRYRIVPGSRTGSHLRTARESWKVLRSILRPLPASIRFFELLARGAAKHSRF